MAATSIADKIKGARLPIRTVPICLETDLQDQFEELEQRLLEAQAADEQDKRLGSGAKVRELAKQIEDVRQQMLDHVIDIKMQAVPKRRWTELVKAHPPRDGDKDDEVFGYNTATFFDAAIRACTVEPQLDDETWTVLLDEKVTARQYQDLYNAVLALNVRRVSVPNSFAASRILQPSEAE